MHLLYDHYPASVLKSNSILWTDVINDLSPTSSARASYVLDDPAIFATSHFGIRKIQTGVSFFCLGSL